MRCLALAQAWRCVGGRVTFLVPEGSPAIEQRVREEGFTLEALTPDRFPEAVVNRLLHSASGKVVLDGYGFGAREQSAASEAGHQVLTVDDFAHASAYPVRWVLNQNVHARPEMYAGCRTGTRLLLGPSYALLREEFRSWLGWRRTIPERATKLLVTIGGSDPGNLSLRILESLPLLQCADLEVVLVAGGSNPHLQDLQAARQRSPVQVQLVANALDIPALMAWADVAVSGAGSTSYELCYMGLPALLFVIAENQRGVAEHLSKLSAAVCAGEAAEFDSLRFTETLRRLIESPGTRHAMSNRERDLVDGVGAERVKSALLDRELQIRLCRETDCQLLFSWANDPELRQASFHSDAVAWEGHQRWFRQKLLDPQSVIYIGESAEGKPVGVVRFHLEEDRAILSVSVDPEFRGTGWGRELIALSTQTLTRSGLARRVEAFVKPENRASIRLFESSGFCREGSAQVAGQPALLFTWQCGSQSNA
jgi:UDP-2,4-diacetamido-2,4,6-trideoxy-beta-L-altropyranose hydrolase